MIAITSCLLTIVSIRSSYIFPDSDYIMIRMDPLRLAAQIVSGVGFLGAGVILRREDDTISGLTTAAMVWGAAGVGLAVGAGFYVETVVGVVLLISSVELLPSLFKGVKGRYLPSYQLTLKINVREREYIPSIISRIEQEIESIKRVRIRDDKGKPYLIILSVKVSGNTDPADIYMNLSALDGVGSVDVKG